MYFPIQNRTHYSLLQGFNKPDKLAEKLAKLEIPGAAITDYSLAGIIEFVEKMEAKKVKPVLGYTLKIREDNHDKGNYRLYNLILLARNQQGWKNLVKLSSTANKEENFQFQAVNEPRVRDGYASLDWTELDKISREGIICIVGGISSVLMYPLFKYAQGNAVLSSNLSECRSFLSVDSVKETGDLIERLKRLFPDLYLGRSSNTTMPVEAVVNNAVVYFGDKLKLPVVPLNDSHYNDPADIADQKILLLNLLETKSETALKKLQLETNINLYRFFQSSNHHVGGQEFVQAFSETEIKTGLDLLNSCEAYKITKQPTLRKFDCPNGMDDAEFLRQLCREGWKEKIQNRIPKQEQQQYVDRVKYELEVLQGAGLSSYFLYLWDIVKFCHSNNWLTGPGRGSAAGCIVSYLTKITSVDPLKYSLLFSRFYNAGRNSPGKIALPDIDLDVPIEHRETIIGYLKDKYGKNKISQISTFGTVKGRNAVKEILRSSGSISFDEMNKITEFIPDEAKIADELQEMREENDGFSSIIQWTLENKGKKLEEWVKLNEDGSLEGPLAKKIEQAIRIEGTKISRGKHAAGLVISPEVLEDEYPMVYDTKTKNMIITYDLHNVEKSGLCKFDLLGIAALSKVMGIQKILKTGELSE
jgi:DNA polymerase-3 subunit alpha